MVVGNELIRFSARYWNKIRRALRHPVSSLLVAIDQIMIWTKSTRVVAIRRLRIAHIPDTERFLFEGLHRDNRWIYSSALTQRPAAIVQTTRPEIGYSVTRSALVTSNPRVSAVISGDCFYLSPNNLKPSSSVPTSIPPVSGLLRIRSEHVLALPTVKSSIETGIFAGSDSPHNWFHWLIDTLPGIYLAKFLPEQFNDVPLLVPAEYLERHHWQESLDAIAGGRTIIPIDKRTYVKVGNLIWVHGPTAKGNFNVGEQRFEFAIQKETLESFRKFFMEAIGAKFDPTRPRTRIYLARSEGSNRPYNQREILKISEKYGFTALYPENHSLKQSIEMILHSEYIIGPHGAGWAFSLFAESAQAALLWTWEEAISENWFHNLLALRGIKHETLFTGHGSNSAPYHLDHNEFERRLAKLLRHG
jgi:hypothetical protein